MARITYKVQGTGNISKERLIIYKELNTSISKKNKNK